HMKTTQHFLLFSLLAFMIQPVTGAEFHVSPSGNDSNPGSADKPFRTLTAGRDAVRRINAAMSEDIVVYLHDGEHVLTEPVTFESRDSGHGGHKVIYCASPDKAPILTGGARVTGWQLHDHGKNIYRAQVSKRPFRQLHIDGVPAIRARTPNRESEADNGPYWPCKSVKNPKTRIRDEHWQACAACPESKRCQVEMVMVCQWYHQRILIGSVSSLGAEVEITPLHPEGKFNKELGFYRSNTFYFENALAFVDAPYEWHHDTDDGILYVALPKGANPENARVEIPVVNTLIDIQGTAEAPVHDIEFRGLTFQYTNWDQPTREGVNMTQASQVIGGHQPDAMVVARHVRKLAFRGNTFRDSGAHGLEMFDADSCDIEGNQFYRIAANGIDIDAGGGANPTPDKQSVDVAVWNNHARQCGSHYSNGIFLMANNVRGLIVAHNLIHDMPYSGMQIGQQPGGLKDVGCGDNQILFNHVHDCTRIHGDGGGIYTLGGIQKGSLIAGNFIHDIHQPQGHYKIDYIYLDNFTSAITVRDNVVTGGKVAERNGSRGNSLENNGQKNPEIEKNAGIKPGYIPRPAQGRSAPGK
ncbi:MAG TPA: right-handed parallel beta-helix repeat-containing protein, partial [Luteolibacter sp.]|nr:right-handed parallel beta-helix repeat-containing protein [Luteolibacter sp.]